MGKVKTKSITEVFEEAAEQNMMEGFDTWAEDVRKTMVRITDEPVGLYTTVAKTRADLVADEMIKIRAALYVAAKHIGQLQESGELGFDIWKI